MKRRWTAMLATVVSGIRAPARWILMKVLFLLSPRAAIDGIEVIDVAEDQSKRTLVGVREALQVIQRVDPRRYARLRQDLHRIVVLKAGGPEFAPEVGACLLPSGYVRESNAAAVATTLVHEATHARLWRRGIGYGPDLRGRVERTCVKEQVAFAERLGDVHILSQLREKLQRPWWTPAQLHERRIAAWRQLGVPNWVLRCYERLVCAGNRSDRRARARGL